MTSLYAVISKWWKIFCFYLQRKQMMEESAQRGVGEVSTEEKTPASVRLQNRQLNLYLLIIYWSYWAISFCLNQQSLLKTSATGASQRSSQLNFTLAVAVMGSECRHIFSHSAVRVVLLNQSHSVSSDSWWSHFPPSLLHVTTRLETANGTIQSSRYRKCMLSYGTCVSSLSQ